jgi:hypothetical protein
LPAQEQQPRTATGTRSSAIVIAIIIVVGAAGVAVATARYGIGLTPDSVTYITGARSLADGDGYTDLRGDAIGLFPPGYSAVLSIGERAGIDAIDGARVLSVLSLAVTIALGYVLVRRHVRSERVRLAATLVIACSAVLLEVQAKALSEHLFIPVLLGFVLLCEALLDDARRPLVLAGAALLAWAAFYLRYAGIVAIPLGALFVTAGGWRAGRGAAVVRAIVWLVAAASAPVLWMLRNDDAVGHPLGSRAEASATAAQNVKRVANELSQWLSTQLVPGVVRGIVLAAAVVGAIALVAVMAQRRGWPSRGRRVLRPLVPILPLVALVVVYVGYLVGSASIVAFARINTRFMLPAFVPVVVLAAWAFEQVRDRLDGVTARRALTGAAAAWIVVNVAWFGGRAINSAADGAGGYASERWQESELMDDVERLDLAIATYSNDPNAVEIFLDEFVEQSPQRTRFQSRQRTNDLRRFVRTVECGDPVQLVWFLPNQRSHLYEPKQLRDHVRLKAVVQRDDGTIFDVTPLEATPEHAC